MKWHNLEFIVAMVGAEGCFWNVRRVYPDLVVTSTKVQLGENGSVIQLAEELVDHGDRKAIFDCDRVHCPVVYVELKADNTRPQEVTLHLS